MLKENYTIGITHALDKKFQVNGSRQNPGQKLFDPGGGFNPETHSQEKTGEIFLSLLA